MQDKMCQRLQWCPNVGAQTVLGPERSCVMFSQEAQLFGEKAPGLAPGFGA